jgi:H-type lectin domain
MPGSTTAKAMPYPLPTEPTAQGADAIRKLAQSTDNMIQTGSATAPVTTAGVTASVAVTFPVPFSTPPAIALGMNFGTMNGAFTVTASNVTTTGFTLNARREVGAASWPTYWIAVGKVVAVA